MNNQHIESIRNKWKSIGPYYRFALIQLPFYLLLLYAVHSWQTKDLLLEGKTAPGFALSTIDGKEVSLKDYAGRPLAIYFFAPWCSVCKISSVNVNRYYASENKPAVIAVGLSYNNPEELREFAREHNLKMPVLIGDSSVLMNYRIAGFPTFYFVDSKGNIAGRTVGFTTKTGMMFRSGS